jgi:conjugative relaxase-like TrwC/TraI family protein
MTLKCKLLSSEFDGSYLEDKVSDNYHDEGGESRGRWLGSAKAPLRLPDIVYKPELTRLLSKWDPYKNRTLGQIQRQKKTSQDKSPPPSHEGPADSENPSPAKPRADHCPGVDWQFSLDKTFSASWAVAPDWMNHVLTECVTSGLVGFFDFLEKEMLLCRRGKGGSRKERVRLLVASYLHTTSRSFQPQVHLHNLVMNVGQRLDGTWGALHLDQIHQWTRTFGPLIRATVAVNLKERLGLQLAPTTDKDGQPNGNFQIVGVPSDLVEFWSSRRNDAKKKLAEVGIAIEEATAAEREWAVLASRPPKGKIPPRPVLHAGWRIEAARFGFTPEKAAALCHQTTAGPRDESAYRTAWQATLTELAEKGIEFTERFVIQRVAEKLQLGQFTGPEIFVRVRADLNHDPRLLRLKDHKGDRQFILRENVFPEQDQQPQAATQLVQFQNLQKTSPKPQPVLSTQQFVTINYDTAERTKSPARQPTAQATEQPRPQTFVSTDELATAAHEVEEKQPQIATQEVLDRPPPIAQPVHHRPEEPERIPIPMAPAVQIPETNTVPVAEQPPPFRFEEEVYRSAWEKSLEQLTTHEADFTEDQLIDAIAKRIETEPIVGLDLVYRVQHDLEHHPVIIRLEDVHGEWHYTTREMWDLEEAVLQQFSAMQQRFGANVPERTVEKILRRQEEFNPEEISAARFLMTQSSAIRVFTSEAGADRDAVLKAAAEGFEQAGHHCVGAVGSVVGKQEFAEKTGIPTRTMNHWLDELEKSTAERISHRLTHDLQQLLRAAKGKETFAHERIGFDEKTVVIVPDASQYDTRTWYRLVNAVEKAQATLVFASAADGLQPILAGGPFQRVAVTLPTVHLETNRRQQNFLDRQAVEALRQGDAEHALRNYAERGRLAVGSNKLDAMEKLVETWVTEGGVRQPQRHLVFTQTRDDAATLNRLCQAARLEAAYTPHFVSVRNGEEQFYRGDRVILHRTDRARGVSSGQFGTILSVDPIRSEVRVEIDRPQSSEWRDEQPPTVATIPLKKFGPEGISLGYACTTSQAQTKDVDQAYLFLGSRPTDRETLSVQVSRGREKSFLFIDQHHAGEDLRDLIAAAEQSRAKRLAHDLIRRDAPEIVFELNPSH